MTEALFYRDPYLKSSEAVVVSANEEGIVLDQTPFFARGGGQPGDSGHLRLASGDELTITDTIKTEAGQICHLVVAQSPLPAVGSSVTLALDWERRYRHMRMHTALHLLCSLVPYDVTGGSIGADKGRLDFDIPESTLDKEALTAALNELVRRDVAVSVEWISVEELAANPALVRTRAVQPPATAGRIRLVRIGDIDLQPCGGTHVASTREVGELRVRKIEKKSRSNRRINLVFAEDEA